jgi:hypothetical protein
MKRFFVLVVILTLSAIIGGAQPTPSIQGVWRITETTGKDVGRGAAATAINSNPEPGLNIFTARYYSLARVTGDRPRTAVKDSNNPTVAELQEERRFAAQAGNYEVKGNTIIFHPEVSLGVAMMASNMSFDATFKLERNTLTLTSADRGGMGTIRMTRVE